MRILGLLLLLCSTFCFAQDATVVELTPHEAAEVKQAYEAKVAAENNWERVYSRVVRKYSDLTFPGADFSKDFRFAVPKTFNASAGVLYGGTIGSCCSTTWSCGCNGSCLMVTPALTNTMGTSTISSGGSLTNFSSDSLTITSH